MKMVKVKRGIANITDAVASIGIALVLIGLVLALAYVAYNKLNATTEVTLVSTIINETRQLRGNNGYGTDNYSQALIQSGAIPTTVTVTGSVISNRSGGTISVVGAGVGFVVTDTSLSNKDCIKLAQQLGTNDMASTKINGQSFTGEITAVKATLACTTDKNTVVFTTKS